MADSDGEVHINTKLDTSGIDSGLNELKVKLNNLGASTDTGTAKTKKFNQELDQTKKKAQEAGSAAEKAGKKFSNTSKKTKDFSPVLNEASGAAGGFASKMSSAAAAGGPYVAAAVAAIAATKKIGEVMRECSDAYEVQEKAELALKVAAENNPYINAEAVDALKQYASELQKVSNIGDETSIQLMAQLVSTGRTQEEIQKIMSAAADYAAATQTDIQSAVQTLNATYSGMSGTLGRQINDIKNLTTEELEQGKAVDIIAEKYRGMAQAMADSEVQTQNLKGDFKEALGELFNPTVEAWDNFWGGFYDTATKWIGAIKAKLQELSRSLSWGGIKQSVDEGITNVSQYYTNNSTGKVQLGAEIESTEYLEWLRNELKLRKELTTEGQNALMLVESELGRRKRITAEEEKQQKAALEKQKTEQKTNDIIAKRGKTADEEATDLINSNTKALNQNIASMKLKAQLTGEEVSAGDMYNAYMQSYIDLIARSNGLITENNSAAKERLTVLNEWKDKADAAADAEKKLEAATEATAEVLEALQNMQINPTPVQALDIQIEQYKTLCDQLTGLTEEQVEAAQAGNDVIYSKAEILEKLQAAEIDLEKQKVADILDADKNYIQEYRDSQQELLDLKAEIDKSEVLSEEEKEAQKAAIDEKYAKNKAELWHSTIEQIKSYTQQSVEYAQQAGDLMLQNLQYTTDAELAKLDEKYSKGEVAETEYYEKQKEIKRKAAQEEYKIAMFQWTASILSATANIAEGVSKAIAQGGTAGLLTGAMVGAAGAVQIASIIASKPIPPSFATGGVVGGIQGATMGGDNTYIHARAGEMVLNAAQQRSLWDRLNGQQGAGGYNLTVNNTQAGRVDTEVKQQPNGDLMINIIDKHINKGFADGTFDAGFAAMNTRQQGVRIL